MSGSGGWQAFDDPGAGADRAPRLAALRGTMAAAGLDALLVPRADAHQGEYVADCDARLAWLTGFSGSAGLAVITADQAGVFVDGRYRVQVRQQTDPALFSSVAWPETQPGPWLVQALPGGGVVGYDPWLHTREDVERLAAALDGTALTLRPTGANLVDAVWNDRPPPPFAPARAHDPALAGETAEARRLRLAAALRTAGHGSALLSLPDSIAWLLNLRGADLPRNPVMQGFAILADDGHVTLLTDPRKLDEELIATLGNSVTILPPDALAEALRGARAPVRLDPATAPEAVFRLLEAAGVAIARAPDPAITAKARKTAAELAGMRAAHRRDGAAMVRLLAWLDRHGPDGLTEIAVVQRLEALRREAGARDLSFDTICGAGPNGAIVHYRVTRATDRALRADEVLLLDSGGQFDDGTTDVTRTVALAPLAPAAAIAPFTAVLRGMIAISRARFPKGVGGAHIDALARQHLWTEGLDYDHGTGHGVGAALCVHEGPVRIARTSPHPLESGMILSNEPGYYREGAFGIRIENLVAVTEAPAEPGRAMLGFETLTWCPVDRRLIDRSAMAAAEIAWLDAYHAQTRAWLTPLLDAEDAAWLEAATAPL